MNKKQYIFLFLVLSLLYLSFKIISFEYKKYQISNYIKKQEWTIQELKNYLKKTNDTIDYINTKAFKNKVLKEDWKKNKAEKVIIFTSEKNYKKFSIKKIENTKRINLEETKQEDITKTMTNYQKWIYFLFKKDIR